MGDEILLAQNRPQQNQSPARRSAPSKPQAPAKPSGPSTEELVATTTERNETLNSKAKEVRDQIGDVLKDEKPSGTMEGLAKSMRAKSYYEEMAKAETDPTKKAGHEASAKLAGVKYNAELKATQDKLGAEAVNKKLEEPAFKQAQESYVKAAVSASQSIDKAREPKVAGKAELEAAKGIAVPSSELEAANRVAKAAEVDIVAAAEAKKKEEAAKVDLARTEKATKIVDEALKDKVEKRTSDIAKAEEKEKNPDKREKKIAEARADYSKDLRELAARTEVIAGREKGADALAEVSQAKRQEAEQKLKEDYAKAKESKPDLREDDYYKQRAVENVKKVLERDSKVAEVAAAKWDSALDPMIEAGSKADKARDGAEKAGKVLGGIGGRFGMPRVR